jgi:hypothetical protein
MTTFQFNSAADKLLKQVASSNTEWSKNRSEDEVKPIQLLLKGCGQSFPDTQMMRPTKSLLKSSKINCLLIPFWCFLSFNQETNYFIQCKSSFFDLEKHNSCIQLSKENQTGFYRMHASCVWSTAVVFFGLAPPQMYHLSIIDFFFFIENSKSWMEEEEKKNFYKKKKKKFQSGIKIIPYRSEMPASFVLFFFLQNSHQ